MRNQKIAHKPIRQNGEVEKKPHKHDTNLQKNSTLYFQVGLIVCLLAAYGLLEMKFERHEPVVLADAFIPDAPTEISVREFKVYEEMKPEPKPNPKTEVKLIDEIDAVDNDHEILKELEVVTSEQNTSADKPIGLDKINLIDEPEDDDVPIAFIQNVPIYPGCENSKNNDERRKCMSDKITKLIKRKFEGSDIASDHGLTGRQRIFVKFTIDKTGKVNDVETRAPNPELGNEAERVIRMIPKMTPGRQNNKNVGVVYHIPIMFQVQ